MRALLLSPEPRSRLLAVQERISTLAKHRVEALYATVPPAPTAEGRAELEALKARKRREMERTLTDVARGLAEKSVAQLDSPRFLRGFAWSVENVLARLYHQGECAARYRCGDSSTDRCPGIHISVEQVLELRRVASLCAERKISLLFAPSHSSHIGELFRSVTRRRPL